MRCLGSAVIVFVFVVCSTSFAQEPERPVFRAGVDLIEVDVSVVDNDGQPVTDLRAAEFTVTVDGKAREVVSAEFVSMGAIDVRTRGPADEPYESELAFSSNVTNRPGRLILIAFDLESVSFGRGRNATRAASRFLDWLDPADKVAFITVPPVGSHVDFTTDHALIRRTLDRIVGQGTRPTSRMNIGIAEALAIVRHNDSFLEANTIRRLCSQYQPGTIDWDLCDREARSEAVVIESEIRRRAVNSINTLRAILGSLAEIDGLKTVVWISGGLIVDLMSGELSDIEELAGAALVTLHVLQLDSELTTVAEGMPSPSAFEDREMRERGLEMLSSMTRGTLYLVTAGANFAFERLAAELSGYYLLGVESRPEDSDGERRRLRVSVGRQDVTVRARREFVMATRRAEPLTPQQQLFRALRSPAAMVELPLRVATYAYQDAASPKVRVLVASEIGASSETPGEVTIAFTLIGPDGEVAAGGMQRVTASPEDGPAGLVLHHASGLEVDPGRYTLKLAAIDGEGRRGSVEHLVQAWQMTGVPLAVSDLILDDTPATAGDWLRPRVEAQLGGDELAAYLEVYGELPESLEGVQAEIQVARERSGETLVAGPGRLVPLEAPNRRGVSATVRVGALPPGRYVARAVITRGDEKVGELARTFRISTASASASVESLIPAMLVPSAFEHNDVLRSDVIDAVLDIVDRGRPEIEPATSQVRDGRFAGAARMAFLAGDQLAAMFLRGLELFASADLDSAATQFLAALQMAPGFTPAAVYLGACYAAGGRDSDAVSSWRTAAAAVDENRLVVAYGLLGDALQRQGDAQGAVAVLREGVAAWPGNDELSRRLAVAYVTALQHADALATIEPYIVEHPTDHEAVLVALQAIYAAHVAGRPILDGADQQERMAKYTQAYVAANGPHEELVKLWAESIKASPEEQ